MEKFQGKYRIPSARLPEWDYGSNAAYFITICIAQRTHDFGAIHNGEMHCTPLGMCAKECWNAIPSHYPFVTLDGFVVMPNHVHGILIFNKPPGSNTTSAVETQDTASVRIETQDIASLPKQQGNQFGPQAQNLAAVVRGFKIGVTKYARQNGIPFEWQERYHDHIIRDEDEHRVVSEYVLYNVEKWVDDRYHS